MPELLIVMLKFVSYAERTLMMFECEIQYDAKIIKAVGPRKLKTFFVGQIYLVLRVL